jgi:putative nucleotidyltransferase with HDIG domain
MLATAVIADELAHALKSNIETAYTAGLLHDIGRLGLCVAYPREYERAIDTAQKRGIDLLDLEREIFSIDHTEAGRYLATRWALPGEFCIIAGRHHDACDGSELSLLRIIHTACSLADVLGYHVVPPSRTLAVSDVLADLPPAAQQRFTLSAQELRARVEQRMYISEFERDEHAEEARVVIRRHHMMAGPEDDFTLELPEPPAEQPTQQSISNRSRWTIATVVLTLLACVCWLILVVMQGR